MSLLPSLGLSAVMAVVALPTANTDLALDIRTAAGASTIVVGPGRPVQYQLIGTLSNASASDGLAYFSTNLAFSGGPLSQAASPTGAPMTSFAAPLGFTNPAGFGGTVVGGELRQVGGAQNTIRNTIAPSPNGAVLLGVAQPSSPAVLATGGLVAPYQVGTFALTASGTRANVILPGQTGLPFYRVDKVANTNTSPLQVDVQAIRARPSVLSVTAGGAQTLSIDAGPNNAGRVYWCLGSITGTSPGFVLPGGARMPLHPDGYLSYTINNPNSPILQNSQGVLDADGRGSVTFTPNRRFVGMTVHHAFYLPSPSLEFVSEAEPVQVVP